MSESFFPYLRLARLNDRLRAVVAELDKIQIQLAKEYPASVALDNIGSAVDEIEAAINTLAGREES